MLIIFIEYTAWAVLGEHANEVLNVHIDNNKTCGCNTTHIPSFIIVALIELSIFAFVVIVNQNKYANTLFKMHIIGDGRPHG